MTTLLLTSVGCVSKGQDEAFKGSEGASTVGRELIKSKRVRERQRESVCVYVCVCVVVDAVVVLCRGERKRRGMEEE